MAGSSFCVSCAQLPTKESSAATKLSRCPECQADLGVTSYGAAFRVQLVKRKSLMTPNMLQGVVLGAGLFAVVVFLVGLSLWSGAEKPRPTSRFAPAPANLQAAHPLAHISEVNLIDPPAGHIDPESNKARLSSLITRIKGDNRAKQDGFLLAHLEQRKELRGLPFIMGDACKIVPQQATAFQTSVRAVRNAIDTETANPHTTFWNSYLAGDRAGGIQSEAGVAALTQILGPERKGVRSEFMAHLAQSNRPEATKVLARAAIFDEAFEVREAAIKALKNRDGATYSDVLMHGMRYPLSAVAKRTAQVMIVLDRKDLLPELVDVLGEAAPGDPAETVVEEKKVCTVREVVRINHHRNCLLCHAPAETGKSAEVPALVPTPGLPFPQSSREYYGDSIILTGPAVRADTTYLRQDFSVMMRVENAAPWPEQQRFDFVVRTRVVEGKELTQLQKAVQTRPADQISENHKAALRVLRELTGQDVGTTQAAWRQVVAAK